MNECKKCAKHDLCEIREAFGAVGCVDDFQPKPLTNADRIRSMSDMELVEFLCGISSENCYTCFARKQCYVGHNGFRDWLQSESEE